MSAEWLCKICRVLPVEDEEEGLCVECMDAFDEEINEAVDSYIRNKRNEKIRRGMLMRRDE